MGWNRSTDEWRLFVKMTRCGGGSTLANGRSAAVCLLIACLLAQILPALVLFFSLPVLSARCLLSALLWASLTVHRQLKLLTFSLCNSEGGLVEATGEGKLAGVGQLGKGRV